MEVPLGEVCTFQRGLTYKKSDEVEVGGTPVLRAGNVSLDTGEIIHDDLKRIRGYIDVPPAKMVKRGALLICTASGSRSHLGKSAPVVEESYAFGGFMAQVAAKKDLDPGYMRWLFRSPLYWDHLGTLAAGMNINNLKFDQLRDLSVPVPPIKEQRRIVAVLDEAFEGLARARANAEANVVNAAALWESVLDRELTASGGETHYLADLVSDDCSLSYGIVQPGDEVPDGVHIVRPTDLDREIVSIDGLKRIDPSKANSYRRTRLMVGDTLLCVRGSTGVSAIAGEGLEGANVTRGIVPIRFDPSKVYPQYGLLELQGRSVQKQIRAATYGAALMQINIKDVRKLKFRIPSLHAQADVIRRANELRQAIADTGNAYRKQKASLERLRRSMLSAAFAGELT